METYAMGQIFGQVAVFALVAWVIIAAIVKVVRYNIIRKQQGEDAAREFWNSKKKRVKK